MAKPAPAATVQAAARPLRVGTSGDYPPFSVRAADGTLSGFDVVVAQGYAHDRGRELELVLFAWPDLGRRLMAGDFDVAMSGVTVRGDRLALAPMTAAVARASAVLVVPTSRTAPAAADGTGLTVAVNRGGHLERIARSRLARATIVTVDDNRSLPTVLASGDVDGVVTDTLELQSFTLHGGPTPRVALVLSEDRKAYWVAPREGALAADLDAWLALREADGTLARLRVQELGGTGERTTDAAERAVVDLVARRLLLMPEVAAVKRLAGLPVDAPAREAEVYARAREEATRVGLSPEPYAAFVRAQVEAAKAVQRAVLAQPSPAMVGSAGETATETAARARARLDTQIRPAIDHIDGALRAALVAAVPLRMPVEGLAAALRSDAPVPGFDARESAALAAALAGIPAAVRLPQNSS